MGVSSAAAIERYDSCCVSDACRRLLLTLLSPTLPTTHTRAFNGLFSMTIRVSRYQTGKTNLDFTEARDSEWQWHQLGHMQICTSLQTDNRASTPPLSFFTGRMLFLPPNQQRQSTEGNTLPTTTDSIYHQRQPARSEATWRLVSLKRDPSRVLSL